MGSYEERLQDISFYGEGDWKVSSGGNCRMRCSRLSVLSEHSGIAVYDPGTSPVPENAKEKMYCQAEAGVKLPVPGCTDIHECSSSGRVFCRKCSAGSCKGSGKTLRKQE